MKVLYIALGKHQRMLEQALSSQGEMHRILWRSNNNWQRELDSYLKSNTPDLTFMQIQTPNIVTPTILKKIPNKIVNFCGDVRDVIPKWYLDVAPYCTSVFTNTRDVQAVKRYGHKALFMPMGFDNDVFIKEGEKYENDIVFMGRNYDGKFPLSNFRKTLVNAIKSEYGEKFKIFGSCWGKGVKDLGANYEEIARYYRGAKIAINVNHYDIHRYQSNRIFQITGAGAFCLSYKHKGIEEYNCGTFDSVQSCLERIDYYLNNETERKEIAQKGYEDAHNKHTWQHRIDNLVSSL